MRSLEKISIGNAAGMIKTLEQVEVACKSAATDITVGSITIDELPGNQSDPGYSQPPYYFHPVLGWSVSSLGLNNMGLAKFRKILPEMVRIAHVAGKKLRVSIACFRLEDYAALAAECFALGADEVEYNLGCPNVWGTSGEQKVIPSYNPSLVGNILSWTHLTLKGRKVDIKVSPVTDTAILPRLTRVIGRSLSVGKVIACNTIPNREPKDHAGRYAISFNGGNHKGGLAGGTEMRHTSLEVCKWMRGNLPDSIDVYGVGGIWNGDHALQYLSLDMSGIQLGTSYYERGPRVVSEVLEGAAAKTA
jgi:dihydroorotate dehydrogenase (fumarate)